MLGKWFLSKVRKKSTTDSGSNDVESSERRPVVNKDTIVVKKGGSEDANTVPRVKLPNMGKNSSRAAEEWRRFQLMEGAPTDGFNSENLKGTDHMRPVHFSRVEKLLARFQAKKDMDNEGILPSASVGNEPKQDIDENGGSGDEHKHISTDESRIISYLSKPPLMMKWKGLGLHRAEDNTAIEILRAKAVTQDNLSKRLVVKTKPIGFLELTVLEAKGLPRDESCKIIAAFAEVRMFPTEQVSSWNWVASIFF
jgi:hypothetical protein